MTKNMTRKGLALGAAASLVVSGFAALPANASGIDNGFVALAPSAGTSYGMLTELKFDLAASFANAAASGGNLKFLVQDAEEISRFDVVSTDLTTTDTPAASVAETGMTGAAANSGAQQVTDVVISNDGTDSVVTLKITGHGVELGDAVTITNSTYKKLVGDTAVNFNGTWEVSAVADANTLAFKVTGKALTALDNATAANSFEFDLVEATEQDALDSADELRAATFGALGATGAIAEKTTAAAGRNADGSYIVDAVNKQATDSATLRVVATEAGSVVVTAWIDNDDDNVIDATEYQSPARTVTFIDAADASFTTSLDAPVLGANTTTSLVASVSMGNDINMAQFATGDVKVDFKKDAAAVATVNTSYNSTSKVLKTVAHSQYQIGTGVFSAQAEYGADADNFGNIDFKTVSAGNALVDGVTDPLVTVSNTVTSAGSVKTGTTTPVTITARATDNSVNLLNAGIQVKVVATATNLHSTSTVTVGDKALTSISGAVTYYTTTDALGKISFTATSNTGRKGDVVSIAISVLGATQFYNATNPEVLTWADAAVTGDALVNTDLAGYGSQLQIAKGGSSALNLALVDNFGNRVTAAGYRVALTIQSQTSGAAWTAYPSVSNGAVSFPFTDNSITTGNFVVRATLQKLNIAGTAYANVAAVNTLDTTYNVNALVPATVSATTADTTTGRDLEPKDFISGDLRLDSNTQSFGYTVTAVDDYFVVSGTVRASTGAPIAGATVTVSADAGSLVGLATSNSTDVNTFTAGTFATGSITVKTDANGAYNVRAWSHKAGSVVFTVVSGAASTTTSAKWDNSADDADIKTVTITAPTTMGAGDVAPIKISVVDKWGNLVKAAGAVISLSVTGSAYPTTYPTTIATGEVSTTLIVAQAATGSVVLTATSGGNDNVIGTGLDDISGSATVVIGVAGNTGDYSSWTKKLDDNSAKIYAKNVVGAGKVQFMLNGKEIAWVNATSAADSKLRSANGSSYLVRTVEFADGKNVLEVYVDGVRTTRTAYTK